MAQQNHPTTDRHPMDRNMAPTSTSVRHLNHSMGGKTRFKNESCQSLELLQPRRTEFEGKWTRKSQQGSCGIGPEQPAHHTAVPRIAKAPLHMYVRNSSLNRRQGANGPPFASFLARGESMSPKTGL